MSDLPLHRTVQDDEIDRLKAQLKEYEEKGRVLMDMCRGLKARVAELTGEVAIQNELMQQMVYTESTVNRKTIADSVALAGPTLLLRKQAEAVEAILDFGTHETISGAGVNVDDVWGYAQRLRQQADELERQSEGWE